MGQRAYRKTMADLTDLTDLTHKDIKDYDLTMRIWIGPFDQQTRLCHIMSWYVTHRNEIHMGWFKNMFRKLCFCYPNLNFRASLHFIQFLGGSSGLYKKPI
jgi:hypothetical protein